MFKVASRLNGISYAVRDIVPLAKELEKKGRKVIYLNIGDPLAYDFDTPPHIKQALYEVVRQGFNRYSLSEGDPELREAIAEKEKKEKGIDLEPGDVIITAGVSEAINFLMASTVEPGDEVLVPDPVYPLYANYAKFYGGKPVYYKCSEIDEWEPDIDDVKEKISDKTKLLVVINPNNPTGAVYREKTLKELLDVAAEANLLVATDEIYDKLVYDGEFKSLVSLSKETPIVMLNGFSKSFLVTGWRVGYMYVYDPGGEVKDLLINQFTKLCRLRLSCSLPAQKALARALRESYGFLDEVIKKLRRRRDFMCKRISEVNGLSAVKPKGSFFVFPRITAKGDWRDDREFALSLLREKGVVVVFGSGFGSQGLDHFRAVFLPPEEVIEEAVGLVEEFIREHSRGLEGQEQGF